MPRTKPFDEHFTRYEEWFEKNHYAYLSELQAVRHFVPANAGGVEIGVGSGMFAKPLGIRGGVEPSESMRALAQARGLQVYDAVAEHLPFKNAQFDFVLMVTTLCFVDDVKAAFEEAKRILKNNGRFIIGFVDKNSLLGKTYEAHKDKNVFYRDATFYSADEVIALLQECGFNEHEEVQTIFGNLHDVTRVQQFEEGYGHGGFVVVCAAKPG
jgi:SAM-dependent methyltransferase